MQRATGTSGAEWQLITAELSDMFNGPTCRKGALVEAGDEILQLLAEAESDGLAAALLLALGDVHRQHVQ